jgi:hypothetical protein
MRVSGQLGALGVLPPGDIIRSIHYVGGWVGPRAGLEAVKEKYISCLCRETNPESSVVHLVT